MKISITVALYGNWIHYQGIYVGGILASIIKFIEE